MTEQDLINAGFQRTECLNAESDNGYDYYYYLLDLCEGMCLVSSDSDDVQNENGWIVKSFDIPGLNIYTSIQLQEFITHIKLVSNC